MPGPIIKKEPLLGTAGPGGGDPLTAGPVESAGPQAASPPTQGPASSAGPSSEGASGVTSGPTGETTEAKLNIVGEFPTSMAEGGAGRSSGTAMLGDPNTPTLTGQAPLRAFMSMYPEWGAAVMANNIPRMQRAMAAIKRGRFNPTVLGGPDPQMTVTGMVGYATQVSRFGFFERLHTAITSNPMSTTEQRGGGFTGPGIVYYGTPQGTSYVPNPIDAIGFHGSYNTNFPPREQGPRLPWNPGAHHVTNTMPNPGPRERASDPIGTMFTDPKTSEENYGYYPFEGFNLPRVIKTFPPLTTAGWYYHGVKDPNTGLTSEPRRNPTYTVTVPPDAGSVAPFVGSSREFSPLSIGGASAIERARLFLGNEMRNSESARILRGREQQIDEYGNTIVGYPEGTSLPWNWNLPGSNTGPANRGRRPPISSPQVGR